MTLENVRCECEYFVLFKSDWGHFFLIFFVNEDILLYVMSSYAYHVLTSRRMLFVSPLCTSIECYVRRFHIQHMVICIVSCNHEIRTTEVDHGLSHRFISATQLWARRT